MQTTPEKFTGVPQENVVYGSARPDLPQRAIKGGTKAGKSSAMTSRERVLAAMRRQSVDHLPLCVETLCHGFVRFVTERLPDPYERAQYYVSLGLDTGISLDPALCDPDANPDAAIKQWCKQPAGERYPLLYREYRTARGSLQQIISKSEDYDRDFFIKRSNSVGIFNDFHVPANRSRQYLVGKETDLDALACLLRPLSGKALDEYRGKARQAKRFCDQHHLTLAVYHLGVGDPMIWMSGIERTLQIAMEEKEFCRRYVELVAAWQRQVLEIALAAGVQHVVRRGIYESTDLWSPRLYEEFLFEPLRNEAALIHQAGATVDYVMLSGCMPLLGLIKRAGVDMLSNLDPLAQGIDIRAIRAAIGDSVAFCGGLNNYQVLEKGTADDVRRAVRAAMAVYTPPTGCILAPSDCILLYNSEPLAERNFHVMIDTWRESAVQ